VRVPDAAAADVCSLGVGFFAAALSSELLPQPAATMPTSASRAAALVVALRLVRRM
jgi:hypothetical protein